MPIGWRAAMTTALYGDHGFFVSGAGPAAHFRTSTHAVPVLGGALLRLLDRLDAALGRPDPLQVVDVGAGRGELLGTLARLAPPELAARLRLTAVELAARPDSLPETIGWRSDLPERVVGLLLATEWLDNVPLDVAEPGPAGWRRVLVDPGTGTESPGGPLDAAETAWLARWWPTPPDPALPGRVEPDLPLPGRVEIGLPRDVAWAEAVGSLHRGLALAVDYGHLRDTRPPHGTLTGFRSGRQVHPVPDGSCDLTAHVAMDSVAAAGTARAGRPYTLVEQHTALHALGADGRRPALALASTDPTGYVRALARASTAAELTDPAGLGGHWWLLQPVGVDPGPSGWLSPEPAGPAPGRTAR
ncbi:SAM-dependent methyltransferase [Plantactinospora sp. KLBMP9567]|uniref:SAM-dependent methyltransferase n=1 Tax=Plantactinospora sp. KLBMP9567 TaxID=3085900 RepID=UPI0029827683|nr:SAM-dependent methyltransferase [Plantactinospora sp. KLBMP9567]MDW5325523.1 SAM-dependent methyltransferase [Plantactinospora sp. KLBMP9567]